jgi:hypothetical protein
MGGDGTQLHSLRQTLEIAIMIEGQSGLMWQRWQALACAVE